MIGTTLRDIREYIEDLASDAGEYYLVCGRHGDRPVPAGGLRFGSRATARAAARATEQYRQALRRYDPRLPRHDVIVCQEPGPDRTDRTDRTDRDGKGGPDTDTDVATEPDNWTLSEPILDDRTTGRRNPIEFCHRVAGAVFEALSDSGYDAVETAVMDTYVELAETVADPDELCLCLLESAATELDSRLTPGEQAGILADAAVRMGPAEPDGEPIAATLGFLEERGLVGDYTRSPWSVDLDDGTRSVVVRISDYALSPRHGRLPVLPIVIDLYRRRPGCPPPSLRAAELDGGWRVTLVLASEAEPERLASAPIRPEA